MAFWQATSLLPSWTICHSCPWHRSVPTSLFTEVDLQASPWKPGARLGGGKARCPQVGTLSPLPACHVCQCWFPGWGRSQASRVGSAAHPKIQPKDDFLSFPAMQRSPLRPQSGSLGVCSYGYATTASLGLRPGRLWKGKCHTSDTKTSVWLFCF